MSVGRGFTDSFLGMSQFPSSFRKPPQDLSPGGRKPNLGTGFGLGKPGFKMGVYKDDNDSEDDFSGSLLNKPGFVQKPSDRDLSQQISHLNLYGNQSDSRTGTWNGSGQSFDDQRAATWNGAQSFDAIGSPQASQSNPFSSSSLHNSDASDLWSRGSTSQSGGLPPYSSMSQNARVQSSTTQFSRSFSQPQSASVDRFNSLSGAGVPPISTGFPHSSSPTSGLTSPGRNGLLSLGGRSVAGQLSSSMTHSQNQSLLNNSVSKAIRPGGLPPSLSSGSRSSPNLLPLGLSQQQQQQPQQQQTQSQNTNQQPPHRVNSFGSLTSSGVFSGFGTSRSMSSGSQAGLLSHLQSVSSVQSISSIPSSLTSGLLGGSSDNLSQVIGIGNFDLEFPVLANRGTPSSSSPSISQSSSLPPRTAYGGALQSHDLESFVMVTGKNQESGSDFQIQNEDFPALPGSTPSELSLQQETNKSNVDILFSMKEKSRLYPELLLGAGSSYESVVKDGRSLGDKKSRALGSVGIQTSSSGVITNIPVGMVTDQFGMIGLLTFIRAAETEPNMVTLALGSDLTTLGLNLNSTESLFHTFGSPFSDTTCRPHEIDYHVPPEYLVNTCIRERLAPIRLSRYCEDLLFYLYYTNCGDILQLAAAAELFSRDWRYHKEERVWITRAPGMDPQVKTSSYERGTYYCFDQHTWRKVPKDFHVDYDKLEEKPTLGMQQQSVP